MTPSFDQDPPRKWRRRIFDESKLEGLSLRERSELEIDRDMIKDIDQLVCDVHEESGNPKRQPLENITGALKRMTSMLARVSKSNDALAKRMFWLTVAITVMTAVILWLTWLLWQQQNQLRQIYSSASVIQPVMPFSVG
jgi:hypothetical protein